MDVAAVPKADYEYFSVFFQELTAALVLHRCFVQHYVFYSDSTAAVLVLHRCVVPQYQLVVLYYSV